jgi:hypothetical protein
MKRLLLAVTLATSASVFAHNDNKNEPNEPPSVCLRHGAAATIGAMGRYAGTSLVFKYAPIETIDKLYRRDGSGGRVYRDYDDLPKDAIYVATEYDLEQRKNFEVSALFGWKQANRWIAEGRPVPERYLLMPIFYTNCEKQMKEQTNE